MMTRRARLLASKLLRQRMPFQFNMDLREKLNEHRRQNFLCDVNLIVEQRKFPAHKFVLAATSEYFSNMFVDEAPPLPPMHSTENDEQKENGKILQPKEDDENELVVDASSKNGHKAESNEMQSDDKVGNSANGTFGKSEKIIADVELEGAKANGFEAILKFLYTARFSCKAETVMEVLHNARVLKLSDVMQNCLVYLCQNMTVLQCIPTYQMALQYNYFPLVASCKQIVLNKFSELLVTKHFLEMSPVLLCQMLSDDNLKIPDEKLAMRAVIKWIMHDITVRKSLADRMLASIRFSYINTSDFLTELDKCKDVVYLKERFEACQVFKSDKSLLSGAFSLSFESNIGKDGSQKFPELVSMQHIPRKSYRPKIILTGGVSSYRNSIIDWCDNYDLFAHSWSQSNRLAISRSGHCMVHFDHRLLFLIGGQRSPDEFLNSVEIYDSADDRFRPTPSTQSLLKARKWFNAVQYGRNVYVVGGYSGDGPLDSIETYSPKTANSSWTSFAALDVAIFSFGSVVLGQELFISGGVINSSNSEELRSFCFKSKKVSQRSSMHLKRSQHCLVAVKDCLYAIGGRNCSEGVLKSVERYSIMDDAWTKVSAMSSARAGACAVVFDGLIYVFGGRAHLSIPVATTRKGANGGIVDPEMEVYDPMTNQWNFLPVDNNNANQFAGRSYAAAVLMQPLINSS